MTILVFIFWLIIFCFVITRIDFFKKSGLSNTILLSLFLLKIVGGLAYTWFYSLPAYKPDSDTWRFFNYSLTETDWLLKDPIAFTKDIFHYGYNEAGSIFIGENSYWNDLKSNIIIKLLAVCNVFTLKNYFANIIFFNFFFFFGVIGFYRLMNILFPDKKILLILAIFCMPSFLFWCSGIHKDGLLFAAIGLIFFNFYHCLQKSFTLKRIVVIVLCLLLSFTLRNYVCLGFIPVLLAWWFAEKKYIHISVKPFIIIFCIGLILFFTAGYIHPKLNFLNYIAIKQQEFAALKGGSEINVQGLAANPKSFIKYLPTALDMAFLRPHITEAKNKSYLPAIAEVYLVMILFVLAIFFRRKNIKFSATFWACWFFAFTLLVIAGYTITFSGAIVRYRSLAFPLIIAPLIGMLDMGKIKLIFSKKASKIN